MPCALQVEVSQSTVSSTVCIRRVAQGDERTRSRVHVYRKLAENPTPYDVEL